MRKKSFFLLFYFVIIVVGIYVFFVANSGPFLDSNAQENKQKIIFVLGAPACLWFVIVRLIRFVRVLFDIVTGCKTKKIMITLKKNNTLTEAFEESSLDYEKYQYLTYKATTESGKKMTLLQDKKLCNFRFVRGNTHTVELLQYSNLVINAKHGKKNIAENTGDDFLS